MMNRFFIVLIFAFSLSSLLGIQATEGKWIAPSDANHPNTWMTFRKDIILPKRPEKAVAQIAVDSKYWLWINGQLAVFEGGVKRGPTPKDTYYDGIYLVEQRVFFVTYGKMLYRWIPKPLRCPTV